MIANWLDLDTIYQIMKPIRISSALLLLLICTLLSSCASPRFERDWNEAVSSFENGKVSAPSGPWSGTWTTSTNGHTGDLRCIVSPVDESEDRYRFRYHATWKQILAGTFPVEYQVTKSGGKRFHVEGSQDLGLFGAFSHKGEITKDSFQATYSSDDGDLGSFEMKRP